MDDVDYKREVRLQRRLERLESNNPICLVCGVADPVCLQWHHPLREKEFTDVRFRACSNDHDRLHELEKDWRAAPARSIQEIAAHLLFVFADILSLFKRDADEFIAYIREIAAELLTAPDKRNTR
jgi:hypothetical protein